MQATRPTGQTPSLAADFGNAARYYLGGRRGLLILAGVIVVAGLALNWSWLAAVGAAPLILAALPCAAMCALGLCMSRAGPTASAEKGADDTSAVLKSSIDLASPKE